MRQSWNRNVAPTREITTELAAAEWQPVSFAFCAHFRLVRFLSILLLTLFFAQVHLLAQTSVTTWHYDNARTSANASETTLTPSNVNSTSFGKLFTDPVDGIIVGHPLYLPNVSIPGQGVHNVAYVCTMHDSVYAFDADNGNPTPLWTTSVLNYSPAGATTVPATVTKETGIGWTEVGIISTPVIDPETGTLYLVSETYENANVVHRLHALDVTTGQEKFGGPTTITATYTLNGATTTFADLYQINRPGLLLANGHIYIGFGSNCCNAYSQGWVLSYNAATLQQEGTYTSEPGKALASIWQKGAGLSADSNGNIYGETAEGFYSAGTNLSISVLKISQLGTTLVLGDWFTPYNWQYLSDHDSDLNNAPVILPDQTGPYPHELIAEGKEGTIYVLNRDSMGQLCSSCTAGDTQIAQEIPQGAGTGSGTPVYWNNTLYFTGESSPVRAYTISNGTLVIPPFLQPRQIGGGGHAIITASGNTNGILWFTSGGEGLLALDAITLQTLYASGQAANGRDTVPPLAHFATPIAADGKVFIGTQNSLVAYGLLPLPNLPDLTETSVTNPPATALDGGSFSATDTVQNIGIATAAASTTRYYLSTTPAKRDARPLTGSRAVPSLTSGASSSGTVTLTVIAGTAAGTYFFLACADDTLVVREINESNNCKASAAQVTVSGPDLVETSVSDPPATLTPGGPFSVTDTVQNIGTVTAAASTTRYYLSTTPAKRDARPLTGSRAVSSLAPSAGSSGTVTVTVSAGTAGGAYFLLACADDTFVVPETNESNNCKASAAQVTVSGPDLVETAVGDPPATILDGSSFSVSDTVQNIGTATAAASTTRYYLSTTTSKSGAHRLTGSRAVPSLAPSASSSGTVTVTVSAGTAGGTYFLLACADDTFVVPETNESNNCKASAAQVTVSGPDLVETAVGDPPATILDGSSFSVSDTVQNIGTVTAAASTTRYYLSTTTSKSGARPLTGSRAVPSLAPSASSSGTVTVTVSAGTAGGTYFLLACADDTFVVPETNESNNCKASAAQVTVSGPDLLETAVSDPPATVLDGSS